MLSEIRVEEFVPKIYWDPPSNHVNEQQLLGTQNSPKGFNLPSIAESKY